MPEMAQEQDEERVVARTCSTCGRSIEVTDRQITDLVARQAAVLMELGRVLGHTEAEVSTMVNLAVPHPGVRMPETKGD